MAKGEFGTLCDATNGLMVGCLGTLTGVWRRYAGGTQLLSTTGWRNGGLLVTAKARVVKEGREILLSQENDLNPRLVVCEQGPERLALRVMYSLIDANGVYHGDGLAESILYADREAQLMFAMRFVDSTAHDTVTDAWIELCPLDQTTQFTLDTGHGKILIGEELLKMRPLAFGRGLPSRRVILKGRGEPLALAWYSDDGRTADILGGVGLWHGPGTRAPYYDTWGSLYDQWNGLNGWAGHKSGQLAVVDSSDGLRLRFHWLCHANQPTGELFGVKAMLSLFIGKTADEVARRVEAFQNPVIPRVDGAELRCLDVTENALLYRKIGEAITLTFPRDRLRRSVHLRAFGVDGRGRVVALVNGKPVIPHLLCLGGNTDDPYGPQLARPGDPFVPIIAAPDKGPDEVVVSARLSSERHTVVTLREQAGVGMAYVKWDDRRIYAIHARGIAASLAYFSTRTCCLHEVRGVNGGEPVLYRLPLYWYPTNVATRGECCNELKALGILKTDPARLVIQVQASDPNSRARSQVTVGFAPRLNRIELDVLARLEVLKPLELPAIQFLNSFSQYSRLPEDWPDDWVVVATDNGDTFINHFKEPVNGQENWMPRIEWKNTIAFVQGAAERGDVLIFARKVGPELAVGAYVLCRCWLDSHFELGGWTSPLRPGAQLEVDYAIAIFGGRGLSRDEAARLAQRAVQIGRLSFE